MAKKKPELQLYNTMTKKMELFKPKSPGKVTMYVCGVTVYDKSHIGHARAYVAFDLLYRYLEHLGYEVVYVRNFTDVDDKIISRANERNENPISLSDRFCQEFLRDMSDLQCRLPTHQPRVSDHMEQIKEMIAQIIKNDGAYTIDGDVYFSVDNSPNYGRLSGRKLEDNRAGERVAVDSRKRNPADFALWKAAKPGEPSWESPWGRGRPGWHIECSAMSTHYLTHSFDIHGGGMDLIFPHHENEIAQSCAACPESNVSYWIHNGYVNNEDDKKMSKSGKSFTIRKVTESYHPLALRYFLLGTHYRSDVKYSISQIEEASDKVFYIYQTLKDVEDDVAAVRGGTDPNGAKTRISTAAQRCINKLHNEFEAKLSDDLQTPTFLKNSLKDALKYMNTERKKLKKETDSKQQLVVVQSLAELEQEVRKVLDVLGLLSSSPYSEVLKQLKDKALDRANLSEDKLLEMIEERAQARNNKEMSRADQIRDDLKAKGINLMDEPNQPTHWQPCVRNEQKEAAVPVKKQTVPPVQQEQPAAPAAAQPCASADKELPGAPTST